MALNKINDVSNETLTNIKKKSVLTIGNNPSEKGLSPQKIKEAMTKPIFDENDSVIALFKQIINEMNAIIDSLNDKLSSIDSKDVELLNKINVNTANINANSNSISTFTSELSDIKNSLSTINESLNTLDGKVTNNENAINDMVIGLGNAFNRIVSLEKEIGNLVIGADFVPKTRTIAELSLESDITKDQLVNAIISLFGSAAQVNVGITSNTIPVIQSDGKLPKSIIPIGDGLIYGGTIERFKDDNTANILPSDDFVAKYPNTVQGVEITITTDTTDYSSVYFVVKNASDVTILGQADCEVGDWIVAQGVNGFAKIDNVDAVKSVNGMRGNVEIKPKGLILENYTTSELDDNNIYPTDSAQTGISKLDKRVKGLEETVSTPKPNVVLEIKDPTNPTIEEQTTILTKIKALTNDLTTDLDTTLFEDIVLKVDKTTSVESGGTLVDLTGATVVFNDTIYQLMHTYALDFVCDGTNCDEIIHTYGSDISPFDTELGFGNIGYVYVNEWKKDAYKTIQIIGGEDATNADLIAFLQANGTITGGVYGGSTTTVTPDITQYSLISYEYKDDEPLHYKFTFSLDDNTEFEITISADQNVAVSNTTFAKQSDIPTKTSELTNDSGYLTEESDPTVPAWAKASSKPSYSYSEITNKPTIPTVYNSTITFTVNGTSVGSFTLNASSNKTISITTPTVTVDTTVTDDSSNPVRSSAIHQFVKDLLDSYVTTEELDEAISNVTIAETEITTQESVTIASSSWVEDTNVSPFSYVATVTLENLSANTISIELLNNQAILFATFGCAIGSVSENQAVIYSVSAPSEDITLTFEVVNPVVSNAKTLGFNLTKGGNFVGCDITVYDGTDTSGTVLYSGTESGGSHGDALAINSVVVDIPNGDFCLVLSTSSYFDGDGNITATNADNFTVDPVDPSWVRTITITGTVTGAAIISGYIIMDI